MSVQPNILPSKIKFITYYYIQISWNCNDEILLKVTNLTQKDIIQIKENWNLLYLMIELNFWK